MYLKSDVLSSEDLSILQNTIVWGHTFPWYLSKYVTWGKTPPDSIKNPNEISFYATHMFYDEGGIVSPFFKLLLPLINFIKPKSLIRIKGNFYPQTESLIEHGKHWDYDYEHQAAIFSLNTCDGFTRLDGGQKIGSVENRMLFLDATKLHNSTTCTNEKGRFNINFNYF